MGEIKIILREIPDYLKDKATIITQVMFVSIFALVFINIYSPFNASSWFEVGDADNDGENEIVLATGKGERREPGISYVVLVEKE